VTRKLARKKTALVTKPIDREGKGDLPKVNYSVPDESVYEIQNGKLHAIITTTPKGLRLGWDTCGMCGLHIRTCPCVVGISLPSGIGYLYTKEGGVLPAPPVVAAKERPFFIPTLSKKQRVWPTFQAPGEAPKAKRQLRRKTDVAEIEVKPKRQLPRRTAQTVPMTDKTEGLIGYNTRTDERTGGKRQLRRKVEGRKRGSEVSYSEYDLLERGSN
jgi:hypothetical protein